MERNKVSVSEKIIEGVLRMIWALIPALGMLMLMRNLKAPLYFGVAVSIITFFLMGIFDFIVEVRNNLNKNEI